MLRSSLLTFAFTAFAFTAACSSSQHEVGAEDAGSPDSGKTSDDCTTRAGVVCGSVTVPAGCTQGASTCTDGAIQCGEVTCPVPDAASCADALKLCTVSVPTGCTQAASSCSGGEVKCGEVTCVDEGGDAGSCAGQSAPPCSAPPPGCSWEGPACVDGHLGCGTLVCSDAGPSSDGGPVDDGGEDAGDCAGQVAPPCAPPPTGCDWEGPACVDGHLGCGTLVCSDAGSSSDGGVDAGSSFACGKSFCNAATEYCVTEGGCVETLDGGSSASSMCQPIPSQCTGSSDECKCIYDAAGTTGSFTSNGSACSVTEDCA